MTDREKVIKGVEHCRIGDCVGCPYEETIEDLLNNGRRVHLGLACNEQLTEDVLALLKEQEARELTTEEWQKWKKNQKRDPICMLWEKEASPIWIFKPEDVHEPALLMGKLKLFTGKPTFEQCKAVKWE